MDPLTALREFTKRSLLEEVRVEGEDLCFGSDYRFPRNAQTAYRRRNGERYTLESLLYFVRHADLKHTDYMPKARMQGLQMVTFTDRKPLLEYLQGKVDTNDAIDLVAPVPLPLPASSRQPPAASAHAASAAASRQPPGAPGSGEGPPAAGQAGAAALPSEAGAAGAAGAAPASASALPPSKRYRAAAGQPGSAGKTADGALREAEVGAAGAGRERGALHGEGRAGQEASRSAGEQEAEADTPPELAAAMARERPVRDSEALLMCARRKNAFAAVLAMLNRREAEKKRMEAAMQKELRRQAKGARAPAGSAAANLALKDARPSGAAKPAPSAAGREAAAAGEAAGSAAERQFWRQYMGTAAEELGIDPSQSFTGAKALAAPPALPPPPPQGGPPPAPAQGRLPALPAPPGAAPEATARRPSLPGRQQPGGSGAVPGQSRGPGSSRSSGAVAGGGSRSGAEGEGGSLVPIILVPSASQTLLNLFNARDFLEDAAYVAPDVRMKELMAAGGKKPEAVTISRRIGRDRPVPYIVRDKPEQMTKRDWANVVAVFLLGKEWQFKGWPFTDHVEILDKMLGVYLRFEDDSAESAGNATQWNCKIISVSKYKRHQDRTAAISFWEKLDSFLLSRKSKLNF